MKKLIKRPAMLVGVALGLCFQVGCSTPAQMLDQDAVRQKLHKGQAQAEVRTLLGRPKRMESASTGKSLDVFTVVFQKSSRVKNSEIRCVHVLYDKHACVEEFTYSVSEMPLFSSPFHQEWRAGRLLDNGKINKIEKNVTTRDQLIQIFGPATMEGLDLHGGKTMTWLFFESHNAASMSGRDLEVLLDENSVVQEYMLRNVEPVSSVAF